MRRNFLSRDHLVNAFFLHPTLFLSCDEASANRSPDA